MSGVLVVVEDRRGSVNRVTWELLNRGRDLADKLGTSLSAALCGVLPADCSELIQRGADRVLLLSGPGRGPVSTGQRARLLEQLIREDEPAVVIAAATTTGRTVMPLVAARLRTGLTADCTSLDIDPQDQALLQTRPAIGGNIMATIKTRTRPQMATVRPRSAPPAERDPARRGEVAEKRYGGDVVVTPDTLLEFIRDATQEVDLEEADIVVSGGRGLGDRSGFALVEELAGVLGAAVGASRDAVELGWAGYPHQVGLSGKTVAPRLYLAVGISGKIQHLAGMQTARTIAAINSDPGAQIFQVADIGIVGDALELVPVLIEKLAALKAAKG
ncbi:MAG: electron transfer flavoprotein subunit alpha/FixB family protein [Peptococcaceae bacterium]|jgi:electron transfer flavoprotein alpha subunit|nr:electron transfer flavoprotein subunit alpha/FixB family protein [Peptococcaceae bacterium]